MNLDWNKPWLDVLQAKRPAIPRGAFAIESSVTPGLLRGWIA